MNITVFTGDSRNKFAITVKKKIMKRIYGLSTVYTVTF